MQDSEQERFTRLWTRAQPIVSSYVSALVPDFQTAEDLVQNVAVVLLRKFHEYDPNLPFAGWAIGVAKREVLMMRRSYARSILRYQSELVEAVADACSEMAPELERRAGVLRKCLERLRRRDREMLRYRYAESLSPGDMAKRLSESAGTVRVRLSRIRSSLRKCVERRMALE